MLRQITFSIKNILNLFLIKQKFKTKRFKNKKVTINLTKKNNENYRCVLKNNTKKFVKKFSFVIEKKIFKLIKKNKKKLFEIFKHLLIVYQKLNKTTKKLQLKTNMINTKKNQLKIKIDAQKLKIKNLFKKRQKFLNRENKLKIFLKIKTNEMNKFRRFRNAHKKNFEKINVKIKSLIINKKNMQKIIKKLKNKIETRENLHFIKFKSKKRTFITSSKQQTHKLKSHRLFNRVTKKRNVNVTKF